MIEAAKGVLFFEFMRPEVCAQIVSMVLDSPLWGKGLLKDTDGNLVVNEDHRKNKAIDFKNQPPELQALTGVCRDIPSLVADRLGLTSIMPLAAELIQLQRSDVGDFFNWHTDVGVHKHRRLASVVYLSDFDSHGLQGGSTDFRVTGREFSVRPRVGWCAAFHPGIQHRGAPVTAGVKYAIVCIYRVPPDAPGGG